ncbi:MAG: hypothetical protein GTN76_10845 [Candidatus Aenigmarchaeota archaeon]|nr:hypothetical protein [Candidatus Aenigmarchaeota archaeon]
MRIPRATYEKIVWDKRLKDIAGMITDAIPVIILSGMMSAFKKTKRKKRKRRSPRRIWRW